MNVIKDEPLMSYSVEKTEEGYITSVKVHGKSVNSWNLGLNEEVAQSKTSTIIETYTNGLEFVQENVRNVFAKE